MLDKMYKYEMGVGDIIMCRWGPYICMIVHVFKHHLYYMGQTYYIITWPHLALQGDRTQVNINGFVQVC